MEDHGAHPERPQSRDRTRIRERGDFGAISVVRAGWKLARPFTIFGKPAVDQSA